MSSRLLQVAEEEIRLHSVKFTMDDMARKLRMSKSTLYQQASSKEELIRMVCEFSMNKFTKEQGKILASYISVKEILSAFCRNILGLA